MSILDRHIAKLFLINVIALFVILFSFVVVIDVSLNIDKFLTMAGELATGEGEVSEPGAVRRVVVALVLAADLWWPKLLQLYNFMLGMVMVAAMGFTCAELTRHREFIAMMAAGIGLHRVMRPILLVAVALTLVQTVNQELIIPRIAPLLARDHEDAGRHSLGAGRIPLTRDGQGKKVYAQSFDADTGIVEGLFVLERDSEGRAVRAITADRAEYENGWWILENGVVEPRGATAVSPPMPIDRIESSLDPDELRMIRFRSYRQALSFGQVGKMLDRDTLVDAGQRADLERIRWGRFAMMISGLLSLAIAMPFFIRREPTNMVVQSLKCAPVAMLCLMGGILGASAAIPGVPASLGVFIPVMILTVVTVAQISALKT